MTAFSSIRDMTYTAMKKTSRKPHCQHEYPENTWKCGKCGHEILPELTEKIAETGSGRIMTTKV
jgi:hypothetical protein